MSTIETEAEVTEESPAAESETSAPETTVVAAEEATPPLKPRKVVIQDFGAGGSVCPWPGRYRIHDITAPTEIRFSHDVGEACDIAKELLTLKD